ncbi:MAG: CinA family protein [Candidatus Marinamargulisbacteria bacterium]
MSGQAIRKGVAFNQFLTEEIQTTDRAYLPALGKILTREKWTLSVIESVTGGGIARRLVELPGCSNYFLGGVVAYHPKMKVQYGRVSPKTMADHGVVSAMVTEEMAAGIKKITQSDISIASNGIAGPPTEGYSKDQTGTFFLSWNIHDRMIKTKRFKLEGGRNDVIDKAIYIALSMCSRYLENELRKDN